MVHAWLKLLDVEQAVLELPMKNLRDSVQNSPHFGGSAKRGLAQIEEIWYLPIVLSMHLITVL